jgi:hypothetical protein
MLVVVQLLAVCPPHQSHHVIDHSTTRFIGGMCYYQVYELLQCVYNNIYLQLKLNQCPNCKKLWHL